MAAPTGSRRAGRRRGRWSAKKGNSLRALDKAISDTGYIVNDVERQILQALSPCMQCEISRRWTSIIKLRLTEHTSDNLLGRAVRKTDLNKVRSAATRLGADYSSWCDKNLRMCIPTTARSPSNSTRTTRSSTSSKSRRPSVINAPDGSPSAGSPQARRKTAALSRPAKSRVSPGASGGSSGPSRCESDRDESPRHQVDLWEGDSGALGGCIQKAMKGNIDGTLERAVDRTLKEAVDRSLKEAVDRSLREAVDRTLKEAVDRTLKEAVDRTLKEAVDRSLKEAVDRSLKEAVDRSLEEAVDRTLKEAVERTLKEAVDRTLEEAVDRTLGEAIDSILKRVVGDASEKAIDDLRHVRGRAASSDRQMAPCEDIVSLNPSEPSCGGDCELLSD
ncbi:hypothetical protein FOZ62_002093 [Perkinsus olseni]|uniref:Uncharacterized protein n=1 Tax=Perkinsus olseni TaxID=32597 RepID=A0A7J6RIN8_PEROL|nr:hypothetical protein FOZ62_002093 [Perkinsus olseni]